MSAMDPDELDFKDPPIFVYADYEAMQSADGEHRPIMVCCETAQEDHTRVFYGQHCSQDFLAFLDQLAINEDEFERPVIVMFHNLQGYDSMFILQELYNQHRLVENQVCVGIKVLSVTSDPITSKDSFCFAPFSLASFPKAFELVELKKGFFPHLFKTPENQSYVGPIPPSDTYDPDGMNHYKREEFLNWFQDQVRRHVGYNLRLKWKSTAFLTSNH